MCSIGSTCPISYPQLRCSYLRYRKRMIETSHSSRNRVLQEEGFARRKLRTIDKRGDQDRRQGSRRWWNMLGLNSRSRHAKEGHPKFGMGGLELWYPCPFSNLLAPLCSGFRISFTSMLSMGNRQQANVSDSLPGISVIQHVDILTLMDKYIWN